VRLGRSFVLIGIRKFVQIQNHAADLFERGALNVRIVPEFLLRAVVLFFSLAILAWVGKRGVLDLGLMRREGVNLEAIRGKEPRIWLVAHIDSKWQPVSMITRVVGVIGTAIGLIALITTSAFPDHTSLTAAGIALNVGGAEAMALNCDIVVNAAGLRAQEVARSIVGIPARRDCQQDKE
jgi:hypothetical protein